MIVRLTRTTDGDVIITPRFLNPSVVPEGCTLEDAAEAFDAAVDYGMAELEDIPGQLGDGSTWAEHFVTLHFTCKVADLAREGDQS